MADLKKLPFSLMLDGSKDTGVLKMFPVTARIFDTVKPPNRGHFK